MISQESKDVIDALSIDELRYEVELGNRSRFQREKMAYLKVRLRSLEEGSDPTNPEPPKLIQNLSWLAKNAKNHKGLVAVAGLLLLASVIYANRDSWDIWPSPDPLENEISQYGPSKSRIELGLSHFSPTGSLSNIEEAKRMLTLLGARQIYSKYPDSISGAFGNPETPNAYYEVTIWKETYGKPSYYGVRFGLVDGTYWGCNDSYFEIEKRGGSIKVVDIPGNFAPCE